MHCWPQHLLLQNCRNVHSFRVCWIFRQTVENNSQVPCSNNFCEALLSLKETTVNILYFSYCQQIPHKRPQATNDRTNKSCLFSQSQTQFIYLCRRPQLLSKTHLRLTLSVNATLIQMYTELQMTLVFQIHWCLDECICSSQLFFIIQLSAQEGESTSKAIKIQ